MTTERTDAHGGAADVTGSMDRLLHGPIVPTLLRLAAPTVIVLLMNTVLGIAEAYFVSSLGTSAIAGASLVIPPFMLMMMMSNGGMGGGVAAAIARARGAGRQDLAESLAWHALVLAVSLGALFSLAFITFGPSLYRSLGGRGDALLQALIYSNVLFGGAILSWTVTLLQAALRGAGNVRIPAAIMLVSIIVGLILSPVLILGWLGAPRLGIAGAGLAQVLCSLGAVVFVVYYMRSPRSSLRLRRSPLRLSHFGTILGVGTLSSLGALQANIAVTAMTAAAGSVSIAAIAGYGIASRLEFLMIPIMFGFGTAVITVVGTNLGAGNVKRARRAALINALMVAAALETLGLVVALIPTAWLGIFTSDAAVLAVGSRYLHVVGPAYGFIAIGLELYFAGQGAGKVGWPLLAGFVRLLITGTGAVLVLQGTLSLAPAFMIVAGSAAVFGAVTLQGFRIAAWGTEVASSKVSRRFAVDRSPQGNGPPHLVTSQRLTPLQDGPGYGRCTSLPFGAPSGGPDGAPLAHHSEHR
jgi:putative MATE family efflux protein